MLADVGALEIGEGQQLVVAGGFNDLLEVGDGQTRLAGVGISASPAGTGKRDPLVVGILGDEVGQGLDGAFGVVGIGQAAAALIEHAATVFIREEAGIDVAVDIGCLGGFSFGK